MKKQNILNIIDKLDEVINSTSSNHSTEDLKKLIFVKAEFQKCIDSWDPNKVLGLLAILIEIIKNGSDFFK